MRLLILALLFAAALMPAALLTMLLLKLFPHISLIVLILVNMPIIVGGTVLFTRKRIAYYHRIEAPELIPSWIKNKGLIVLAVIGTFAGSGIMFSSNKADLYVDNGTTHSIKFKLKYGGSFEIPAHSFTKKQVVIGSDNEISYDGKTKPLAINAKGDWVLNVDTQNMYVRTSVVYKSKSIFSKDNDRESESMPDFTLVKDEFFNAGTDYVFDAPETIREDRHSSSKAVTKTVLLRIPPEDLAEHEAENKEDSTMSRQ